MRKISNKWMRYELVSKNLHNIEETAMGLLHKRRQHIRSTKPKPAQNTGEDLEPTSLACRGCQTRF
jgi:hypothetical protein